MTDTNTLHSQVLVNRFRVSDDETLLENDPIAVEEPLQINLLHRQKNHPFTLTMRTPGDDTYLIYGLLFSEGIIHSASQVLSIESSQTEQGSQENLREVTLDDSVVLNFDQYKRRMASYSGCGLCGKTSLQALELKSARDPLLIKSTIDIELVRKLKAMLAEQPLFSQTGGVHAAGYIYENAGELNFERSPFFEDVGRHNALDKVIGFELINNKLNQSGILVLSGRIGFELVQKAVMAGFSIIVALGAPSSLALKAAQQFDITLVGFAKDYSFNRYTAK